MTKDHNKRDIQNEKRLSLFLWVLLELGWKEPARPLGFVDDLLRDFSSGMGGMASRLASWDGSTLLKFT